MRPLPLESRLLPPLHSAALGCHRASHLPPCAIQKSPICHLRHRDQNLDTGWEGQAGTSWESSIEIYTLLCIKWNALVPQSVKNLTAVQETQVQSPGRFPGEGNGNPLQYSCLENPKDRWALWAKVHGVTRVRRDLATKPPHIKCESEIGKDPDARKDWRQQAKRAEEDEMVR